MISTQSEIDMNRRTFLHAAGLACASVVLPFSQTVADPLPEASAAKLPKWRGFNLLEKFMVQNQKPYSEDDFAMISEMGFNFVRLPMDYRCWTDPADWTRFKEPTLKEIDDAVAYGRKHGIHVQLNFHRAPGYTVASPPEPKDLWTDSEAQDVCARHWGLFAKRYQGLPSRELSFNLFNEPAHVEPGPHKTVVERMKSEIHEHDPNRLIVCDGRDWGTKPPTELVGLGVAAATRGYAPFHLTHYRASWVDGSDKWPKPTYPLHEDGYDWDETTLNKDQIVPWKALESKGVGVMVGEFGCHNQTPHDVVIPWMRDCLAAWDAAGWGWALWNFRGSFGPLDSDRPDVAYETWHGHKLDKTMMNLLREA
jgi:endoglucanase